MVTMDKASFSELVFLRISLMDESSDEYKRFCDIVLTCLGVVQSDGTLAPEYAASPIWIGGDDGTPLRPSVVADIATKIPAELWPTLSSDLVPLASKVMGSEGEAPKRKRRKA